MPPLLVPQYGLERDSSPFLADAGNISVSCGCRQKFTKQPNDRCVHPKELQEFTPKGFLLFNEVSGMFTITVMCLVY